MRNPKLAALANFFLPGVGYLLIGQKRERAVLWLIGVIGLTYVEFGIRESEPTLYAIMFASVFIGNIAFAIDVYRLATAAQDRSGGAVALDSA